MIERAQNFVKQKEAEIKLKIGKNKQNKAADFLKNLADRNLNTNQDDDSLLDDLGFAYQKTGY